MTLEALNAKQKEAVTAPLQNTLVLAGAGSGKTRVLVSRIAWLIENQSLSPYNILAVTFTNKAAGEMRERLSELLDSPLQGMWVGTFHGLCNKLLRIHAEEAKLPPSFHILDSDDQTRVIKRVLASLNLEEEQWPAKQAQAFINSKKDEGLRPSHVHVPSFGPARTWLQIYQGYEQACQASGVVDFAELILRTLELFRQNPELLSQYQHRFQAILVDEFQDTNAVQYAWIRLLASGGASVMVVGDDDQSIYGWRGAKIENIQHFSKDFANTHIIRLEENYRSTASILAAANGLIANNNERLGKDLWTQGPEGEKIILYHALNELEEARFVKDSIQTEIRKGRSFKDIAILYRSNAQSRVLEEALLREQIPYRIHGGLRFFERAEIKDALGYLRLLLNVHDDTAFERVVNFPTRGIGDKTLDLLRDQAKSQAMSLWQAALQIIERHVLTSRAEKALHQFISLIEKLSEEIIPLSLEEQLERVLQASGLYQHFSKIKGDRSESRLDNLQELYNAMSEFRNEQEGEAELSLLAAFLAHASLEAGEVQKSAHESAVHLMTLHAAKGLEFQVVFLVGMEEGLFPGVQSLQEKGRLEEERRLCYVGMTRARENLFLSFAEIRHQYGRVEKHRPSRFLRELPQHLILSIQNQTILTPSYKVNLASSDIEIAGLRLGQNVQHPKFGRGTVLRLEGSGEHARVQVQFEDSAKWLVIAYANLS
jgi:DNA helicase-2/ATP-dependent DNA helicase PcrA